MRWKLVLPALLATAGTGAASGALHGRPGGRSLVRRAEDFTEACTDLTISENKGDRKVAIVIDSSGSMADSDPSDLRLVAGRALNSFLISADEAGGGQKPDQVTVIDFDSSALVVYPLGDPNNEANASFALIDSAGGTYIADGVRTAMDELTKTGNTDKRSAIVVFTDGSVCAASLVLTRESLSVY